MNIISFIPSKGLGDLVIIMGLAQNLSKEFKIHIYHPLAKHIQHLAPFAEFFDRPQKIEDIDLKRIFKCVMIYEDSEFFDNFYKSIPEEFKDNFIALNPVVTPKKDYRFSENFFFNPYISFQKNLLIFGKQLTKISLTSPSSGLTYPAFKDPKLVVMHVTASKETKNWSSRKFLGLKKMLEDKGYTVIFATLPHEKKAISNGLYSGLSGLKDLSNYLAKASLLIANESGVCHLASALNTKSLVICRNRRIQTFWAADFEGKSYAIYPPRWLPNLKKFRLRDKFWKRFIFKSQVYKKALELLKS